MRPDNRSATRVDANRQLLAQGLAALDRLTDAQYANPRGAHASVGAQYRHVLDHYRRFLSGLPGRDIDYDLRDRDPAVETSRVVAASATRELRTALGHLDAPADTPIRVQLRIDPDATEPSWATSTIGRELQFLVSHTVHHFALIKLLLAGDEVALDPDFGVAPSTLAHARARR